MTSAQILELVYPEFRIEMMPLIDDLRTSIETLLDGFPPEGGSLSLRNFRQLVVAAFVGGTVAAKKCQTVTEFAAAEALFTGPEMWHGKPAGEAGK